MHSGFIFFFFSFLPRVSGFGTHRDISFVDNFPATNERGLHFLPTLILFGFHLFLPKPVKARELWCGAVNLNDLHCEWNIFWKHHTFSTPILKTLFKNFNHFLLGLFLPNPRMANIKPSVSKIRQKKRTLWSWEGSTKKVNYSNYPGTHFIRSSWWKHSEAMTQRF